MICKVCKRTLFLEKKKKKKDATLGKWAQKRKKDTILENGRKQQRLVLWPVPYRYAAPSVSYQQHFPPLDKTLIDSNKEKKRKQAEEKPDLFTHRVSMSHRIDGHGMKHEYTLLSSLCLLKIKLGSKFVFSFTLCCISILCCILFYVGFLFCVLFFV